MLDLIGKAYAQTQFQMSNLLFVNPNRGFGQVIGMVVNWILILAGAIAVIYLVYGGILYITAGGDAEKATKGRTAVINAIIGIVIILLALVVVNWVYSIITSGTA